MAMMQVDRCSAYVTRHYQTALGDQGCDGRMDGSGTFSQIENLQALWLCAIGGYGVSNAGPSF